MSKIPINLFFLPIIFFATASTCPSGEEAMTYTFRVDGKVIQPHILSLNGMPESPQPGDLAYVDSVTRLDDFLLVLGSERWCDFRRTPPEDGRLLLVHPDGTTRVVAAKVGWGFLGREKIIYDPLARLTEQEIHGLWGLTLDEWPEGTAERLNHLDPERVCITVKGGAAQGPTKVMPMLPEGLRWLRIESSGDGIRDLTPTSHNL